MPVIWNLSFCFLGIFFRAPIPVNRYEIRPGYGLTGSDSTIPSLTAPGATKWNANTITDKSRRFKYIRKRI